MRNKIAALKNDALNGTFPVDYDHIKALINSNADSETLTRAFQSMLGSSSANNAIFSYNAGKLIKATMLCLTELRDQGMVTLSLNVIRESLLLEKHIEMLSWDTSDTAKQAMSNFLASVCYVEGKPISRSCQEQHGYARSYFSSPMQLLCEIEDLERILNERDNLVSLIKPVDGSGEATDNSFVYL